MPKRSPARFANPVTGRNRRAAAVSVIGNFKLLDTQQRGLLAPAFTMEAYSAAPSPVIQPGAQDRLVA